jgi:hypothetical protein
MDGFKVQGMRRAKRASLSSPRMQYRAEIDALIYRMREARDRLPLGEETSVEIAWLAHRLATETTA